MSIARNTIVICFLALTVYAEDGMEFFRAEVEPILRQRCLDCHSHAAGEMQGGLALDWRSGWQVGGGRGPAIMPHDTEKSLLIRAISHSDPELQMPEEKLPDREIAILTRWVAQGAPDHREVRPDKQEKPDESPWWSLIPLVRPAIPVCDASHPIDAFIGQTLQRHGMALSPAADRRTLIRRLHYDLIGLPPEPHEVEAFVVDPNPRAYEILVDRLLASPGYGEHWARHWFDTIHFADSHGYEHDLARDHAWPYRDYVIQALNRDIAWPEFIREQLAADVFLPDDKRLTPALGFLGAGPFDLSAYTTAPINFGYLDRDDLVNQTMSAFVSTTANCARCHDHKFDPISQQDYYALQAVFAGVRKGDLEYDLDPQVARERQRLKLVLAAATGDENKDLRATTEAALAKLPPPGRVYAASAMVDIPAGDGMTLKSTLTVPEVIRVLQRGDVEKPLEEAQPGTLSAIAQLPSRFALSTEASEGMRRAALADWLADGNNSLTWRSAVNRVWHYHFGRGICDTPSDFGRMGGTPSHPELLDWLAVWFRDDAHGSLKALHRLIVTSGTFRQASHSYADGAKIDSDNRLLWRQHRRRLDADAYRDSILSIAGNLDRKMGGPAAQHFQQSRGPQVTPALDYTAYDWARAAAGRRSIYRFVWRGIADPFMESLDFPDLGLLTPARTFSASALQALTLYNNPFVLHHCQLLADRLAHEESASAQQVRRAVHLIWLRDPDPHESDNFTRFAEVHGLAALCRVLLNSNEFLFVD